MAVGLDVDERNRIIGDNLRKYRLLKGLTQDDLADGLCSVSQLSKVENGKTYVKRTMLKQMADRLGVTVERIESADALFEELTETLQLAKDYVSAKSYEIALDMLELMIPQCVEFGYQKLRVEALHLKFIILIEQQAYTTVILLAEQALEDELYVSSVQKMMLLLDAGLAYEMSGNQQAAFDCYLRADEEFESIEGEGEHSQFRHTILFGLAKFHGVMGNDRACLRYAEKAEREAIAANMHLRRIRCYYLKAIPLRRLGDIDKAEQIYLEALKETQDNSFLLDTAIIQNNLGEVYQDRGETGLAQQCFKRALQLFELLDAGLYLYRPQANLAELEFMNKNYDRALSYVESMFCLCENLGVNAYRELAGTLRLKAKIMLELQDKDAFDQHMHEALAIYQKHNVLDEAYSLSIEIANFYYENGNSQSVEFYRQAVEYNNALLAIRR
ncbi:tetratricopeptide repeat protein [Tumebacillus permanentifrigoris]|uniref:Tetratricopeptide repeat protein n=1 Tax=Tumebacillus permanentifrigoris TaxID=378543 RepID=A0A316D910_9BACL|nr:tetratricopeptide repeat protein [Tumebacillus permanentifrigoris]PWK13466.1 tetratricopeptide repeat protein [Tumebacillus permanentifrigoris]